MSEAANVRAIQTLQDMQSALGRFAGEAQESLASVELEIRCTLEWLQERLHHWQREVERWRQEVQRARAALERCERSGYRDRDGRYHVPDCSAYEAALATAQRRLQEAETELAKVRHWMKQVQQAVQQYRRHAQRLQQLTTNRTKRAEALLRRKRGDLERYKALSLRAFAGVLPTLVQAIPVAYDRAIRNVRSSVRDQARKQEIELVRATGRGTRDWSKPEIRQLKAGEFPKGYHAHHINNVTRFPSLAGDPDNIKFVTHKEHFRLHRRDWRHATSGKMYNRKSLMIQWATYK